MIQDIVNEIAEKAVKGLNEFIGAQLKECGYDADYLRAHRYDFITVHVGQDAEDGSNVSFMVHVPDERVLFGIKRTTVMSETEDGGATVHVNHTRIGAELAQGAVLEEIKRCAREAREQCISGSSV